MKNINITAYTILVILITLIFSGCTILLPAHTKSNMTKGEQRSISPIKCDNISADFVNAYSKGFPERSVEDSCKDLFIPIKTYGECTIPPPPTQTDQNGVKAFPLAGIAASAMIGLATDFIKKKLEEEKTLYTAQHKKSYEDDKFWSSIVLTKRQKIECVQGDTGKKGFQYADGYKLKPSYIGFEYNRLIKDADQPAMKIIYGMSLSSDKRFFLLKPIYFKMNYAKAKILSNEAYTWLFPPTLLMKLFKIPSNTVDVELDLNMKAYWTEKEKKYNGPETIAAFKTTISGYDINNSQEYTADKINHDGGWLLIPPISDALDRYHGEPAGNFDLKIAVTERDTSEATKLIEITEEWVSKGTEKLKEETGINK